MEMNATAAKTRCAVRLAAGQAEQRGVDGYLHRHGLGDAVRFLPREDDDLDAQVCAGHFDLVVFPDLHTLLMAIWESEPRIARWAESGVRIELADPGAGEGVDWLTVVRTVDRSLWDWRRHRRRRQVIGSIVLSLIALAAVAALLFLIPPAG